jgi:hypothetical protein
MLGHLPDERLVLPGPSDEAGWGPGPVPVGDRRFDRLLARLNSVSTAPGCCSAGSSPVAAPSAGSAGGRTPALPCSSRDTSRPCARARRGPCPSPSRRRCTSGLGSPGGPRCRPATGRGRRRPRPSHPNARRGCLALAVGGAVNCMRDRPAATPWFRQRGLAGRGPRIARGGLVEHESQHDRNVANAFFQLESAILTALLSLAPLSHRRLPAPLGEVPYPAAAISSRPPGQPPARQVFRQHANAGERGLATCRLTLRNRPPPLGDGKQQLVVSPPATAAKVHAPCATGHPRRPQSAGPRRPGAATALAATCRTTSARPSLKSMAAARLVPVLAAGELWLRRLWLRRTRVCRVVASISRPALAPPRLLTQSRRRRPRAGQPLRSHRSAGRHVTTIGPVAVMLPPTIETLWRVQGASHPPGPPSPPVARQHQRGNAHGRRRHGRQVAQVHGERLVQCRPAQGAESAPSTTASVVTTRRSFEPAPARPRRPADQHLC